MFIKTNFALWTLLFTLRPWAAHADESPRASAGPAAWAKSLAVVAGEDPTTTSDLGDLSLVIYRLAPGKGSRPHLRPIPINAPTLAKHSLFATRAGESLAYNLRLNDITYPKEQQDNQKAASVLARRMMRLSDSRLALDLGVTGGSDDGPWRLWALAGDKAHLVHQSIPSDSSDRSTPSLAAFLRHSLGYDGRILARNDRRILARVAAARTAIGQVGLVLANSAEPLRITDERERQGAALVKVVEVEGPWAILDLVASPAPDKLDVGAKVLFESANAE